MRKLLLLLALLSPVSAFAADNAVIVTPGAGVTMRSKDTTGAGGPQSMFEIPGDTSGNGLATAPGTGNTSFALPIQGVASGVAVPISGSVTANAGTNLNTSTLATSANQTNASQKSQIVDGSGNVITSTSNALNVNVNNAIVQPTPLRLSALSTTVQAIKGSAGSLFMVQCGNTNASQGYVQVFNVVSGSVTLGTTSPTLSIPIAATNTGGFALAVPLTFNTAMSAAATTTATGSTALGTPLDCNMGFN